MPKPPATRGRRVRDAADAQALLTAIATSKQPLKTWCAANDINVHSLYWWRAKLSPKARPKPPDNPRLHRALEAVPVAEVTLALPTRRGRYEVALPNGVTLRLEADFHDDAVARLLALAGRC